MSENQNGAFVNAAFDEDEPTSKTTSNATSPDTIPEIKTVSVDDESKAAVAVEDGKDVTNEPGSNEEQTSVILRNKSSRTSYYRTTGSLRGVKFPSQSSVHSFSGVNLETIHEGMKGSEKTKQKKQKKQKNKENTTDNVKKGNTTDNVRKENTNNTVNKQNNINDSDNINDSNNTTHKNINTTDNTNDNKNDSKLKKGKKARETSKKDKPPERQQWDNQCEFILSTVGYAVGLGNIWRFPYVAYKNGGGSFLIPYTVMLLFVGLPLFFLELCLGQYAGQGPTRVYGRLAPALKGLGFAMLATSFYIALYYNVILAWTLFYMFNGFHKELPWSTCPAIEPSVDHCYNNTLLSIPATKLDDPYAIGASEYYFTHELLGRDRSVHDWTNLGKLRWQLVLCLALAWTIVCLCLIKGVQSAGKVVYFTGK